MKLDIYRQSWIYKADDDVLRIGWVSADIDEDGGIIGDKYSVGRTGIKGFAHFPTFKQAIACLAEHEASLVVAHEGGEDTR